MRMRLQTYDLNITHVPGKDLVIADTLSRAHLSDAEDEVDPNLHILEVVTVLSQAMSENKRDKFVIETEKDGELQCVMKLIRKRWPNELKDVPEAAKAYHTYNQIEEKIQNCKTCLNFQRRNQKETLKPSEIPEKPWDTIGIDLFYFRGNVYLLIVDYFSKYVDITHLKDETSITTIKALKASFVRWGILNVIKSDNG